MVPLALAPTAAARSASGLLLVIYGPQASFGRVPHWPASRLAPPVTGPMTRTVVTRPHARAIAGRTTRRGSLPADGGLFLAACEDGLEGLSVGWSADFGYARVDPEVAELCGAAAEQFEGLGCHVEVVTPSWENPEEIFRTLSSAESYAAWRERLEDSADQLDPSFVSVLKYGHTITIDQYMDAARRRLELWTDVQRFLARFDLLITPTVAVPPFPVARPSVTEIDGEPVSPLGWIAFTFPFNLTGQPAASVPVLTSVGLPVGSRLSSARRRRPACRPAASSGAALPRGGQRSVSLREALPAVLPGRRGRHGRRYASISCACAFRNISLRHARVTSSSLPDRLVNEIAFTTVFIRPQSG